MVEMSYVLTEVLVTQGSTFIQTHRALHLRAVQVTVYKSYLDKTVYIF